MQRNQPFGFFVAGFCSALFAWGMLMLLLDPYVAGEPDLRGRGAAALLAALSIMTTEALWCTRPWAWRASLSLALAYAAVVLLAFGTDSDNGLGSAMLVLVMSSFVLVPTLIYIHRRSRQLWPQRHQRGRGRVHLPAASPYPPAHVAAARAATCP